MTEKKSAEAPTAAEAPARPEWRLCTVRHTALPVTTFLLKCEGHADALKQVREPVPTCCEGDVEVKEVELVRK